MRKGETFAELAAGFAVGTTTAWRYVEEVLALLATRAPKLRQAVRDAKKAGYAYVVLDGTLIPIDRVAADRPFYSGKHKKAPLCVKRPGYSRLASVRRSSPPSSTARLTAAAVRRRSGAAGVTGGMGWLCGVGSLVAGPGSDLSEEPGIGV